MADMPAAELILEMPKSTAQEDTTTSLAEIPAGKEGDDPPPDHGAEGLRHILGIPVGAEIQQEPHEDRSDKDGGSRLRQIILHLFPHIDEDGSGAGGLVFRQFNEQRIFFCVLSVKNVNRPPAWRAGRKTAGKTERKWEAARCRT